MQMMWTDWIWENGMVLTALILTFFCAVYDMKKKEIPILPMAFGAVFALIVWIWRILTGKAELMEMLLTALPGIFLLAVSLCSKERVGCGDGTLLVMIGLMAGFPLCFIVLWISLLCSSIYALFLIVFKKAKRGDSFPFAPFLALAVGLTFLRNTKML